MRSARETAVYMKYYKLLLAFGSVKCTHSLSERWTFIETCPTKIGKQKNISSLSRMQLASNRVEWIKSDTIGATNEVVYLLKNISKRSCRVGEEGGALGIFMNIDAASWIFSAATLAIENTPKARRPRRAGSALAARAQSRAEQLALRLMPDLRTVCRQL